jgi:hypothetical protein
MSANRKNLLVGGNDFQKVKSFLAFASTIYAYFLNFGGLGIGWVCRRTDGMYFPLYPTNLTF